jgi:hypothetical protein
MNKGSFIESVVDDAALAWLESLRYVVKHGAEIAPGEFLADRTAAVAKNATTEFQRQSARNEYCLEAAELGQGILPGSWAATSAKMQKFRGRGNRFLEGK